MTDKLYKHLYDLVEFSDRPAKHKSCEEIAEAVIDIIASMNELDIFEEEVLIAGLYLMQKRRNK